MRINILPSFSNGWLIPKLPDFQKHYSCSIDIQTGDGMIDFEKTGADIAIRVKKKNIWKEFHVKKFMGEEYLKAVGCDNTNIQYKLRAKHFFMLIQAAKDSQGIALIPRILIEKELQQNQLVVALETNFKSDWNYYCLCPKQKSNLKKVKHFQDWIGGIES